MRRVRSESRCARTDGAPYEWIDYVDAAERVVENELGEALEERCATQAEYEIRRGEISARKKVASQGLINDDSVLEPVRRNPDLWELKWSFAQVGEFRLYHAEPDHAPQTLLALKYHWKSLDGSQDEIDAAQDAQMDEAGDRYGRYRRRCGVDGVK